ncbi:MAG TPA: hypothetical protein VLH79_05495 [Chthonomonadales bacterium]|nr:hypothetical protein [Chthonomonadales bacterium]
MKIKPDRDMLHLLPTDPLPPDDRERAERLRDWCLVWFIAALTGWGLALGLALTWPADF